MSVSAHLMKQQFNEFWALELMMFICLVQDKSEEIVMPK